MNRNSNLDNLPFSNKKLVNIAFIRGSGREFSPNCSFHCAQNEETIIIIIHTLKKKKNPPTFRRYFYCKLLPILASTETIF